MSSYYEKLLATGEVKCIDEEVPFEVPKGWKWCRLRDVIYPPKYGTSSKSLSNGDVPVLRMGNIQDGKVVYDKLVFSNNVEDNRKYLLQDGDLLFNRTNSAELVGKTAIFKGNRHVIYAGYLILLRPIKTNSEYLNYIFSSPYVRSYCKEVKTIGVQQCNINAEKVSQLLVPIAPFEEQMRIVDKIKEVLPSVDKYSISQHNLDLLNVSLSECLKKSILQEAIQGRLVPQITEEGTAKELLEQIKKEKQKLVKEGKLKKSALATSVIFRGDDNKYYEHGAGSEAHHGRQARAALYSRTPLRRIIDERYLRISLVVPLCGSKDEIPVFSGYEIPHLEKAVDRFGGSGKGAGPAGDPGADR